MRKAFALAVIFSVILLSWSWAQPVHSEKSSDKEDIVLSVEPASLHIATGETLDLHISGADGTVTWTSDDPYAVSVDASGRITGGHKSGTAVITAASDGKTSVCTVTNNVVMRDISASQLVSELTIGADWNDYTTIPRFNMGEIPSVPLSVAFTIWDLEEPGSLFGEGRQILTGQKIAQRISLPEADSNISSKVMKRASINFWYAGDKNDERDITVKIENARLTAGGKVYSLDYLNGTHRLSAISELNAVSNIWFCGAAVGDGEESGLPALNQLSGGEFSADLELVSFQSDYEDLVKFLCASTNGDVPLSPGMLDDYKAAGFDFIRIPFTFTAYMNEKFELRKEFLDRLEQVVNWALDRGLYCIIDTSDDYLAHSWVGDKWDEQWLKAEYADYVNARYAAAWRQIAQRFKDYDDHLIFGSFNEPNGGDGLDNDIPVSGSRWAPSDYEMQRINELTDLFVDTVTATGSNNAKRHLYVATWMAGWEANVLEKFQLPSYDRLIASVHYYYYGDDGSDRITGWDVNNPVMTGQMDLMFRNLKKYYLDKGIPVIITEFGTRDMMDMENRIGQAKYILNQASQYRIPCTWFEGGGWFSWDSGDSFGLYDRNALDWKYPELLKTVINEAGR